MTGGDRGVTRPHQRGQGLRGEARAAPAAWGFSHRLLRGALPAPSSMLVSHSPSQAAPRGSMRARPWPCKGLPGAGVFEQQGQLWAAPVHVFTRGSERLPAPDQRFHASTCPEPLRSSHTGLRDMPGLTSSPKRGASPPGAQQSCKPGQSWLF